MGSWKEEGFGTGRREEKGMVRKDLGKWDGKVTGRKRKGWVVGKGSGKDWGNGYGKGRVWEVE